MHSHLLLRAHPSEPILHAEVSFDEEGGRGAAEEVQHAVVHIGMEGFIYLPHGRRLGEDLCAEAS